MFGIVDWLIDGDILNWNVCEWKYYVVVDVVLSDVFGLIDELLWDIVNLFVDMGVEIVFDE